MGKRKYIVRTGVHVREFTVFRQRFGDRRITLSCPREEFAKVGAA